VSDKFVMDPRVSFVTQILEEVEHGIIKIPRFQRELVWKWEQQRDLLCSIIEGIPIGSILVWSTNLKNITAYDSIGPFSLKYHESHEKIPQQMYLMDGLQRISTLYTIVKHPEYSATTSDLSKYEVFADLLSNSINSMFLRKKEILNEGGDPNSYQYLPLRYIFDQKRFMRFLRQIPSDNEALIDRADDIVIAFKSYKVPMIPMRSDKQELVTKSFERINTKGTVMSEAHMLNALSYSPEFELLTSLNKFKKQFLNEFHSEAIDQNFILQLIKLQLGISIYDKNTDSIAKKVNDELLQKIFTGLRSLLYFARNNFGDAAIKAFPYRLQALGVCHVLIVEPDFQVEYLRSWVTVTAYAGAFGTTARNSELALEDWIRYISTRELKWSLKTKPTITLWKDNVSFRNARFKLWALALAHKHDAVLSTNLGERFLELKGKLINKPIEVKDKSKRSANYFLTLDKSFSLENLTECQIEAYFLDDEMLNELKEENYIEFRELRETAVFNYEVANIFTPAAEMLGLTNYKIER